MRVSIASAAECGDLAARALGLGEATDLFSGEGLAASLRRAASFMCPAPPRQIADAVLDALRPLRPDPALSRDELNDLLGQLISAGDLLELQADNEPPCRLLYLGPPSYVEKQPGQYLLLGIRPFGTPLISASLASKIRYEGHTRTIDLDPGNAESRLSALGLHKVRRDQWVSGPRELQPGDLIDQLRQRLAVAGPAGEVDGLTILDPALKVTYYRGRWRELKAADSGNYMARRPQEYGADLWCFVSVASGRPRRLIDFPVEDRAAAGHDEAWRVQAAIDASRNNPQVFRVTAGTDAALTVDFFSPVPRWAERYLELVGTAISRTSGALFSYQVPSGAMPELSGFLTRTLWMRERATEEQGGG